MNYSKARHRLAFFHFPTKLFLDALLGPDAEREIPHRLKCHDSVLLKPLRFANPKADPALVYEVVRLMPPDGRGDNGYRIKAGAIECAVVECEIRAA